MYDVYCKHMSVLCSNAFTKVIIRSFHHLREFSVCQNSIFSFVERQFSNSSVTFTSHNWTTVNVHIIYLYLLRKSCTRHSRLENVNEYKNTQLYKPIQYTHSATYYYYNPLTNAETDHGC